MTKIKNVHVQKFEAITLNHLELIFEFDNDHFEAIRIEPTDDPEKISRLLHTLAENIRHNVKEGN